MLYMGSDLPKLEAVLGDPGSQRLVSYHIKLVGLMAACSEGKNVYTEMKCQVP